VGSRPRQRPHPCRPSDQLLRVNHTHKAQGGRSPALPQSQRRLAPRQARSGSYVGRPRRTTANGNCKQQIRGQRTVGRCRCGPAGAAQRRCDRAVPRTPAAKCQTPSPAQPELATARWRFASRRGTVPRFIGATSANACACGTGTRADPAKKSRPWGVSERDASSRQHGRDPHRSGDAPETSTSCSRRD
jgi:hypothetical protein